MRKVIWVGVGVVLGLIAPLQASVVLPGGIAGTAIIWAAGHSTSAPDLQASLPPSISFDLGSVSSISFSGIGGSVKYAGGATPNGAEGQAGGTNINGYGGISGIQFDGRQFFLMGVFLGASEPSGSGPAKQVYSTSFSNSSAFNPLLSQVFFIGDGQGGAGKQTFNIPTGATRLFWGFGDGVGSPANPGTYGDNSGSVSLSYDLSFVPTDIHTPEPSSLILMGLGIGALTLLRRRRA